MPRVQRLWKAQRGELSHVRPEPRPAELHSPRAGNWNHFQALPRFPQFPQALLRLLSIYKYKREEERRDRVLKRVRWAYRPNHALPDGPLAPQALHG